jgi:hypothetical protein
MAREVRKWLNLNGKFGAQRAALAARVRRGYHGHERVRKGVEWRDLVRRGEEGRLVFGAHDIV